MLGWLQLCFLMIGTSSLVAMIVAAYGREKVIEKRQPPDVCRVADRIREGTITIVGGHGLLPEDPFVV